MEMLIDLAPVVGAGLIALTGYTYVRWLHRPSSPESQVLALFGRSSEPSLARKMAEHEANIGALKEAISRAAEEASSTLEACKSAFASLELTRETPQSTSEVERANQGK